MVSRVGEVEIAHGPSPASSSCTTRTQRSPELVAEVVPCVCDRGHALVPAGGMSSTRGRRLDITECRGREDPRVHP